MTKTTTTPAARPTAPGAVVVEIYDQVYQLSGTDPGYIEAIAALVDKRMRAVAAGGATVDSLRVAVLAALNIADELLTQRARYEALEGVSPAQAALSQSAATLQSSVQTRTGSLLGMLDDVLAERKAG
jgi:cell division protein ZapA